MRCCPGNNNNRVILAHNLCLARRACASRVRWVRPRVGRQRRWTKYVFSCFLNIGWIWLVFEVDVIIGWVLRTPVSWCMEDSRVVLIAIVTCAGRNSVHVRWHSCCMDHWRTELSGPWMTQRVMNGLGAGRGHVGLGVWVFGLGVAWVQDLFIYTRNHVVCNTNSVCRLHAQIEHHLFPRVSSAWYPSMRPIVQVQKQYQQLLWLTDSDTIASPVVEPATTQILDGEWYSIWLAVCHWYCHCFNMIKCSPSTHTNLHCSACVGSTVFATRISPTSSPTSCSLLFVNPISPPRLHAMIAT